MKTKLVTAFYSNLGGEPFYGHSYPARMERYLHSLRTLNNMDTEIVCYCNDNDEDRLLRYCEEQNLSNVQIKVSNLRDYPNCQRMIDIKEKTDQFKFYHEVDWNKIYLLRKEMDPTYDYLYWIDCGLSHRGLFLFKYNEFEPEDMTGMSRDWVNYAFTGAFCPELFPKINEYIGTKLLNLGKTQFDRPPGECNRVFEENLTYTSMTVGGIIGGHTSRMTWFLDKFDELAEFCLNKDHILNHEQIMGKMAMEYPFNYKSYEFNTWYHDDYWMSTTHFNRDSIKNMKHFVHFWEKELNI